MHHPEWKAIRREGPKPPKGSSLLLYVAIFIGYAAAALYFIVKNGP